MMKISKIARASAMLAALAIAVTGCTASTPEPTAAPVEETVGLAEETTVTVAFSNKTAHYIPYLMEEVWGEFAKLNIKLQFELMPAPDALVLLASGRIDAMVTGPSANLFNAISEGMDVRMVAPGGIEPEDTTTGWYVDSTQFEGEFKPEMLKGKIIASTSGVAGPPILTFTQYLEEHGMSMDDVEMTLMRVPDAVIAMENGAIFGTTASQPNIKLVTDAGGIRIAPTIPVGWPGIATFFGPNLLNDKPEVGEAFVLGLLNTYINHMQGDYTSRNADDISRVLETAPEIVALFDNAIYPTTLSFPKDYLKSYEDAYRQMDGVLSFEGSFADQSLDTRFMEYANAHAGQ